MSQPIFVAILAFRFVSTPLAMTSAPAIFASLTSASTNVRWDLLSTNGIKATGFQPVRFSVMYYNLPSHF